ncbi:HNH endonuclease [Methylocapsa acidiphila]|uniref:HNH endonuclease n=1 Tax=Methylocapsa acidiphila TaxID=133552 RepID=UPI00068472DA|nr:HNH endonuclease [Methylocapsa acidiphila]
MKPLDDKGHELDAIFTVEPAPDGAYLVIESRGGGEGGPRPPRNADYALGLELLLRRLGQESAKLTDVEVYSNVTRNWAAERRRISAPSFSFPLDLAALGNLERFRHELGRESAALGRKPGKKGGNPTKKLRLTLQWPDAIGRTAGELEDRLARNRGIAPADDRGSVPLHRSDAEPTDYRTLQPEQPTSDPNELRNRVRRAKRKMEEAGASNPPPAGTGAVGKTTASYTRYLRDPNVIGWVLIAAGGTCEVCDLPAPFKDASGEPFLEVHHVRPLAEGGPDQTDNAVAVCPNCHRRLHFGVDKETVRHATIAKVMRLKEYPANPVEPSVPVATPT